LFEWKKGRSKQVVEVSAMTIMGLGFIAGRRASRTPIRFGWYDGLIKK
jgi:hypothetical protein